MKEVKINVARVIRVPSSADDWELFTASMPCNKAANALTAALCKALAFVGKGMSVDEAMHKYMDPVMDKYADCGAADSEPRYHAVSCLSRLCPRS